MLLLINATANVHPVRLDSGMLQPHKSEVYAIVAPHVRITDDVGVRVRPDADMVRLSSGHTASDLWDVPHSGWHGECSPRLSPPRDVAGVKVSETMEYDLDLAHATPHVKRIADYALELTYSGMEPTVLLIASEITARALRATLLGSHARDLDPQDVLSGRGTMPVLLVSPVLDGSRKYATALRRW
jgi:hypothetical protein